MEWLLGIFLVVFFSFSFVLLFGAPYLPTLDNQVKAALELAALKPGDCLLELGCGDGKVMVAAAKLGVNVVGYELNPFLVCVAYVHTFKYRKHVKIYWGNFWLKTWPTADVIFVFLLPKYMEKLDRAIDLKAQKPVKLVSHAFVIAAKKPTKEKDGVFLYEYR